MFEANDLKSYDYDLSEIINHWIIVKLRRKTCYLISYQKNLFNFNLSTTMRAITYNFIIIIIVIFIILNCHCNLQYYYIFNCYC